MDRLNFERLRSDGHFQGRAHAGNDFEAVVDSRNFRDSIAQRAGQLGSRLPPWDADPARFASLREVWGLFADNLHWMNPESALAVVLHDLTERFLNEQPPLLAHAIAVELAVTSELDCFILAIQPPRFGV